MIDNSLLLLPETSLLSAFEQMDKTGRRLLIVADSKNKYIGVISVGDIQRAILNKQSLETKVSEVLRSDALFAKTTDDISRIKELMVQLRIESMPVVDENSMLVDVYEWNDILSDKQISNEVLDLPVVIMAGGKGTRLHPLTNVIPKPLVPISDKTIIEEIMDKFIAVNCKEFYLSVNYLAQEIKDFFSKKQNKNYTVDYFQEDKPRGTAGSLSLLKGKLEKTFFVSNCDILFDVNLSDLLSYHRKNGNAITVVSVIKTINIPYGTIETSENGVLEGLTEKPTLNYQINSGLYVVEPDALDFINGNEFLHITDLIIRLKESGKKVGVFPISEGSWMDMGNWDDYLKVINRK